MNLERLTIRGSFHERSIGDITRTQRLRSMNPIIAWDPQSVSEGF